MPAGTDGHHHLATMGFYDKGGVEFIAVDLVISMYNFKFEFKNIQYFYYPDLCYPIVTVSKFITKFIVSPLENI